MGYIITYREKRFDNTTGKWKTIGIVLVVLSCMLSGLFQWKYGKPLIPTITRLESALDTAVSYLQENEKVVLDAVS